ncbi:S-layer homology domain-containing protein [Paenibacillus sp. NPDC058071]|uniref:S-layer homology domain-containing protein n=1 Tax=Paenibacillus sp. NPDC058071 TaxID=3346326 RepID=UPI0036DBAEC9
MKKKWTIIALSTTLTLTLIAGGFAANNGNIQAAQSAPSFRDLSGHWAQASIDIAVKNGIMKGYPDGTFKPEGLITRAELMKVLAVTVALNVDEPTAGKPWYTAYQNALSQAGIQLASDFSGDVNKPATRLELAKLSVRASNADYRSKKLSSDELLFRAVNAGLLSRTGAKAESIEPAGTTTRAQAAVLAARLLKLEKGEKLAVDQGASSAAEMAWHKHNFITMIGQEDMVKLPYSITINPRYKVTIEGLTILDPADKQGYLIEYLEGAQYGGEADPTKGGYVFAYKLKGESLGLNPGHDQLIRNSFYMLRERDYGDVTLNRKYHFRDGKLIDRTGLYENKTFLNLEKKGTIGYDYYYTFVSKSYVKDQIKQYGGFPIHLEKFSGNLGDINNQIFLTAVKDKWAK